MKIIPWTAALWCLGLLLPGSPAPADVLPEPAICAGPDFRIQSGKERPYGYRDKWGWASYQCQEQCPGPWTDCAYPCPETGLADTCLALVIDQMGGTLRWSEDRGAPGPA